MSTARQVGQKSIKDTKEKRLPYQSPAIIFYGTITTRAGTPIGLTSDPEKSGVDPADLFGNGG